MEANLVLSNELKGNAQLLCFSLKIMDILAKAQMAA